MWSLYLLFRREHFDIVHSTTPKAGLLCALAGFLAGVPVRLHTFTGQVWIQMHGASRFLAKAGDWVTANLNTMCYADSASQREFIIGSGLVSAERIQVLGAGSLAGVDLERFNPEAWEKSRATIRGDLGIGTDFRVITFIGRLTKEKGIDELIAAFRLLRDRGGKYFLILVGPSELEPGSQSNETEGLLDGDPQILLTGYADRPERYLAVTDLLCLPSYREGFGNVVIEAAAMGIPTVGTDIVGLRDSIVDGETGLLVPLKDPEALASALERLFTDEQMRTSMGRRARERATKMYDAKKINAAVLEEYDRLWGLHEHRAD
jgi:glycosyltransferase involved in cell wall biosynthesis